MLRLTEVKLPLDHSDDELRAAIIERLGILSRDLLRHVIFGARWMRVNARRFISSTRWMSSCAMNRCF
jgi:uncharacterized ferritin-like protein (DUF455 family)